jgi:hypothetical protein
MAATELKESRGTTGRVCNDPKALNRGGPLPCVGDDYLRGLIEGMQACVGGFVNLGTSAAMLFLAQQREAMRDPVAQLLPLYGAVRYINWVDAAKMLGIEPGKATILERELAQPRVGGLVQPVPSPLQSGKIVGQRICAYAIIPGAGKAIKGAVTVGETPVNPLRGQALQDLMTQSEAELRQEIMSGRLKAVDVETPAIHHIDRGSAGNPALVVTDNVFKSGRPGEVFSMTDEEIFGSRDALQALREVNDKAAKAGYVLGDLRGANVVFRRNSPGRLTAIVIDPDFVMTVGEYASSVKQGTMPGKVVGTVLWNAGKSSEFMEDFMSGRLSAQDLADALFDRQFPSRRSTGTVPTR